MSVLVDRGLLEQYPIDVSVLQKGDIIDTPTLEKVTGKSANDPKFILAVVGLRAWIEKKSKENGIRLISRIRANMLMILTDEQAVHYTRRHAYLGRRKFYRNHRRQMDVDTRSLPDNLRQDHEHSIIVNGRMIAAMQSARSLPAPKPHERTVPLIEEAAK